MCPGVWSVSVEAAVTERGAVHYITPAAVATVAGPPPYQADLRLASVCDESNESNVTYGANRGLQCPVVSMTSGSIKAVLIKLMCVFN